MIDIWKAITSSSYVVRSQRFLGSAFYPVQRAWFERKYSKFKTIAIATPEGKILGYQDTSVDDAIESNARFYFQQFELEIRFLTEDFVVIDWQPKNTDPELENLPPLPYGISHKSWAKVKTTITQTNDRYCVSSESLKVIVAQDGAIAFENAQGQTLRQELPPQRHIKESQGGKIATWIDEAQLPPEEHIYGLGERAAYLNLRKPSKKPPKGISALISKLKGQKINQTIEPATYKMWNKDAQGTYGLGDDPLYICIPFYLGLNSQGSYGIFYENPYPADLTFNQKAIANFQGGALRYYFVGATPQQIIDRYTELTGRPALPPRWALGYHQSRWGYEKESALRETVKNIDTYKIPVSALHLDIDCLDNFKAFSIDPDRFPHLAQLAQDLITKGTRFVSIINPGIRAHYTNPLYQQGRSLDLFCKLPNGKPAIGAVWPGLCAFPDFTNPQARQWWVRQYPFLLDMGIAGFWHDMNEPAVLVLSGDPSLGAFSTQHYLEGRQGDHREAHNVYGFLQTQAGYQALRQYQPHKRPFIVSRSGWAGLQRYAWTWTGDIEGTWSALRQTLPMVLNLGLTGIPYSGPDIGGFQGNPSSELYLRWFQLSTFLPFCRTHSSNNAKERTPWTYGEPTLSIIRDFLNLRYQLMPYFYTLAWEAHQKGYPLVRPVFWAEVENTSLWDIDDSFLLGDALLVSPVLEKGAVSRPVTLPKGHWYNYWDDTLTPGDQTITCDAPKDRIPLLVKAGSILPMEADVELILHCYPTPDGSCQGVVYSDAGDGFEDSRIDRFQVVPQGEVLELSWQTEGDYPLPYKGVRVNLHGFKLEQAWADNQEIAITDNSLFLNHFDKVYLKVS